MAPNPNTEAFDRAVAIFRQSYADIGATPDTKSNAFLISKKMRVAIVDAVRLFLLLPLAPSIDLFIEQAHWLQGGYLSQSQFACEGGLVLSSLHR